VVTELPRPEYEVNNYVALPNSRDYGIAHALRWRTDDGKEHGVQTYTPMLSKLPASVHNQVIAVQFLLDGYVRWCNEHL
jgi:hypothetical protein